MRQPKKPYNMYDQAHAEYYSDIHNIIPYWDELTNVEKNGNMAREILTVYEALFRENNRMFHLWWTIITNKDMRNYFRSLKLEPKSYLVISDEYEFLEMFKVMFITCDYNLKNRDMMISNTLMLSDLKDVTMGNLEIGDVLAGDYNVEHIYVPKQFLSEKQENFFHRQVLLDRVKARRTTARLATLVTSEVDIPDVKKSGLFEVIELDRNYLDHTGLYGVASGGVRITESKKKNKNEDIYN